MKRALAIAVAVCTLGVAGFSQIAIKGSWTATIGLLPSTTLTSSLTLTYTVAGFDITSVSGFGAAGLTSQRFALKGAFGPFSVSGNMWFGVTPPAYLASDVTSSFDFGGVAIGATVRHWTPGNFRHNPPTSTLTDWWPDTDPCATQTPPGLGYLQAILTAKIDPVSLKVRLADCCTGFAFEDLLVTLTKIPLCCGISVNAEFYFKKAGFDYLSISGINVPLCCGVSFDVGVKYTTTAKSLTITPKFAGFAEACFTVWGDAKFTANTWEGIEIWGYRIRCTIAGCNYLELVNAFNALKVNDFLATADRFLWHTTLRHLCGTATPQVAIQEFELVKLGFCGPGCCGGTYSVILRIFFGDVYTSLVEPITTIPTLFDITRFVFSVSLPIMTNFTVSISGTMYTFTTSPSCNTLSIGWTFTF